MVAAMATGPRSLAKIHFDISPHPVWGSVRVMDACNMN